MATIRILVIFLLQWVLMATGMQGCDRKPDFVEGEKSKPDGRFRITMSASPVVYVPREMYTVKLNSSTKFIWFSLWVEAAHGNLGNLHLFSDAFTKYSDTCSSTITASSFSPKTEIQALWNAPVSGSGCVSFKATVVEQPDTWYQEDGPLTYTICEDLQEISGEQRVMECCACDEAKYEVSFEGLWSRQTHPKDFPDGENTRFSDVIGASHTIEYRFWDYGGIASEGLREVAELGSTRTLESELKSQSQHIRTIIKARGIAYPNVTGKTFAVFRVDSRHHLISLVSMIMPSPDWIVGVSGLELCLPNCTWVETYVRNLYPWDAGTDSGVTYLSPDNKTDPKDRIRRITAGFPSDPKSPFYNPSGDLKPLAKLYLTRQRLYEKSCDSNPENAEACDTNPWGEWSPCSVSCGKGQKTRQRWYKNKQLAHENGCNVELTLRSQCYVNGPCRVDNELESREDDTSYETNTSRWSQTTNYLPPVDLEEYCNLSNWSDWSGCSVMCGIGEKHRFRRMEDKRHWKECLYNYEVKMQETMPCNGTNCGDSPMTEAVLSRNCTLEEWSDWSPCSVSCGEGVRKRIRTISGSECIEEEAVDIEPCVDKKECIFTPEEAKENKTALFNSIPPASFILDPTLKTITGVDGPVVDCKVSSWSKWEPCSQTCGDGYKRKMRRIIQNARNGGRACPRRLLKTRKCNEGPCYPGKTDTNYYINKDDIPDQSDEAEDSRYRVDDCIYSDWTPWTHCTPTCGLNSIQRRSRTVKNHKHSKKYCPDRVETRVCNVLPCIH